MWNFSEVGGEKSAGCWLVLNEVVPTPNRSHDFGHRIGRNACAMPLLERPQFGGKRIIAEDVADPPGEVTPSQIRVHERHWCTFEDADKLT
jgi:hypothetical protein